MQQLTRNPATKIVLAAPGLALVHSASRMGVLGSSFIVPGAAFLLAFIAVIIPVFFVLMWVVGGYNRLVALRNGYKSAYASVDGALKRRYDLIPELVETAKGYLQNDRGTIEAVSAARNAASAANGLAARSPGDVAIMEELSGAEAALSGTLCRLLSATAACAELKKNPKMVLLMQELTAAAAKAASVGQSYNDAAMKYNILRAAFPTSLIAGPFSFNPAGLLALGPNPV